MQQKGNAVNVFAHARASPYTSSIPVHTESEMSELLERITMNPTIRDGRPIIRGTHITVSDILEWLASGMSEADIISDFPDLTHEDILAALTFAARRE